MSRPKVLVSQSKKQASTLGTAKGGAVSKFEHKLLWDTIRVTKDALDGARQGHNRWQEVQDAIEKLEDEFADPEEI